jgi:hypothetical protein
MVTPQIRFHLRSFLLAFASGNRREICQQAARTRAHQTQMLDWKLNESKPVPTAATVITIEDHIVNLDPAETQARDVCRQMHHVWPFVRYNHVL